MCERCPLLDGEVYIYAFQSGVTVRGLWLVVTPTSHSKVYFLFLSVLHIEILFFIYVKKNIHVIDLFISLKL